MKTSQRLSLAPFGVASSALLARKQPFIFFGIEFWRSSSDQSLVWYTAMVCFSHSLRSGQAKLGQLDPGKAAEKREGSFAFCAGLAERHAARPQSAAAGSGPETSRGGAGANGPLPSRAPCLLLLEPVAFNQARRLLLARPTLQLL